MRSGSSPDQSLQALPLAPLPSHGELQPAHGEPHTVAMDLRREQLPPHVPSEIDALAWGGIVRDLGHGFAFVCVRHQFASVSRSEVPDVITDCPGCDAEREMGVGRDRYRALQARAELLRGGRTER
jgi:hypothetical protein